MSRFVVSALIGGLVGWGAASPAVAQYKVVGPDGRITYTDRRPSDDQRVKTVATQAGRNAASGLPYELGLIANRYPVTLYSGPSCPICDTGRTLLIERGIPFTEFTISSSADAAALTSKEGTDQIPVIRIGSKRITGFESGEWTSYLDAAGYPKRSALPSSYQRPAAKSLATPAPTDRSAELSGTPTPFTQQTPVPFENTKAPSGIRF